MQEMHSRQRQRERCIDQDILSLSLAKTWWVRKLCYVYTTIFWSLIDQDIHSLSLSLSGQDMVGQEVMLCVHNILDATTFWALIDQDSISYYLTV
jgi:hypothetical protein